MRNLRHADLRLEAAEVLLRHLPVKGQAAAGAGSKVEGDSMTHIPDKIAEALRAWERTARE
jgi:hypothetical protein